MPGPSDRDHNERGTAGQWRRACQDGPATPCGRRRDQRLVASALAHGKLACMLQGGEGSYGHRLGVESIRRPHDERVGNGIRGR